MQRGICGIGVLVGQHFDQTINAVLIDLRTECAAITGHHADPFYGYIKCLPAIGIFLHFIINRNRRCPRFVDGSLDATEVTVKTAINKPGAPPVPVDYEMKKTAGGWKAFDVTIEGVSMVTSYRGTFATQIEQNGIDGLIKMLSDKNANAANVALRKTDTK